MVSEVLWYSPARNFTENTHWNVFEISLFETVASENRRFVTSSQSASIYQFTVLQMF